MNVLAGTALLAFGGYFSAQRSREDSAVARLAGLIGFGSLALLLPMTVAPCVIGLGWLLTLTAGPRNAGWDLFAVGCATYGHGLLIAAGMPHSVLISPALWVIGWMMPLRGPHPLPGRHGLRWELARARRASAPVNGADVWRIRASDALRRADQTLRMLAPVHNIPAAGCLVRGGVPALITEAISAGAAALADGDCVTARDEFARARKAVSALAGTVADGREELSAWLELIGWCELAATLIDEEDLN